MCGDADSISFQVSKHGNAKNEKPFYAVKKSTLIDFKSDLINDRRKRTASAMYDKAFEKHKAGDYGDYPRSKKQLIDISHSICKSGVNEVGDLFALNAEIESKIVWHHSDVPSDIWVIGTDYMSTELSKASELTALSVDRTFNFGKFEVTPFTYRHPNIESKSRNIPGAWVPATMLGPTVIQSDKKIETCYWFSSSRTKALPRK